jgi:hypothetical protein
VAAHLPRKAATAQERLPCAVTKRRLQGLNAARGAHFRHQRFAVSDRARVPLGIPTDRQSRVAREDQLGLVAKRQTNYRDLRLDRRDLKLPAFRTVMLTKQSADGRTAGSPFDHIRIPAMGYN